MNRDRHRTERRIVRAAGELLAEKGFDGLGVNVLARRAGVDKVLIYRYFGGVAGVVKRYAEDDFWPSLEDLFGRAREEVMEMTDAQIAADLLVGHLRELTRRPITQDIMRQELLRKDELTDALANAREETAEELLSLFSEDVRNDTEADLAAVGALIHAGISYLVLRAKSADAYMGVELGTEAGRHRLEAAIRALMAAFFSAGKNDQQ